jgi:N-ethylmaleimide reductase
MSDLFSSLQLGAYRASNRVVMAPLTRCRTALGGIPTELMAQYYAQRATAGLIISEATCISAQGIGYPNTPGIWNGEQMAGWARVTQAVHEMGGHIVCQLWHVGRISHPSLQPDGGLPVAPSAIQPAGEAMTFQGTQPFVTPRALELAELPKLVEQYRIAAQNAMASGFDGVEVHAANGYLLDEFLRDGSNQRTDAYGGSLENRSRLLIEVLEAVCAAEGADRVGVRLSPIQPANDMRDSDPEGTFSYVVDRLSEFGLAYLHVTNLGIDKPGTAGPYFDPRTLRQRWKGIYMSNHGYDRDSANTAVKNRDVDLVAFGVPYIANPDLVARFKAGAPLNAADPTTFYGGTEIGYTDYPVMS